MSRNELKKRNVDDSGNETFMNDINLLTKALYEDKTRSRGVNSNSTSSSNRSKSINPRIPDTKSKSKLNEDRFLKDKKSIWSWNSLKSFTHVRNKRFNCCFSLQVHSIEGLPSSFNGLKLCVKWKRRDGELTTQPAPVIQGVAEFGQLLTNTCSVYGSRSGPHHSAKYEAKHFLLYASVYGDSEVDLGKHRVDLTRLLPLTLEELEDEKSSGEWTTTYRLSGKAKGGTIKVSFGYSVVGNSPNDLVKGNGMGLMRSPSKSTGQGYINRGASDSFRHSVEDIKDLHEVLPTSKTDLSESMSILYKKLEEEKSIISVDYGTERDVQIVPPVEPVIADSDKSENVTEFSVLDQGIEFPMKEECVVTENSPVGQEFGDKDSLLKELESALDSVEQMEKEGSDSQEETEKYTEGKIGIKEKGKSVKLDDATEAVADDFLNMLGIEHSPFSSTSESESNSPRERLLRQFEKDSLANGSSLFNFDDDDISEYSPTWGPLPEEEQNRTKASILEDLETEALMREWGLNEKVFQRVPSDHGPVDFSPEEPLGLPPLGDGLGPFVQTSNGGFLRSMNPEIFKNAKNGGNLVMQVSSPVVVPAEMGSGIMDVLQCLASVGIEKLSMQANKLMPLEDISGKTMQQLAWESTPTLEAPHRQDSLEQVGHEHTNIIQSSSRKYETGIADPEYVSLEDLAPLAMNKIEALSIEGLRIQSGMSEKDAPQSIGDFEGKMVNLDGSLGLEGTGGLQLMDIKNKSNGGNDDDVDGIMGLSVTLDEWMRLDSGEIDDGDEMSERTCRILAAHHASDEMRSRRGKRSKKGGLLGNNFTVALMVQLRDPLRNFEPVGTPMLALVQVERVFVPPKPKIHSSIFALWNKPEEEVEEEKEIQFKKVEEEEEKEVQFKKVEEESVLIPQFKITEVHVAGVKTEETTTANKKPIWGSNTKQQQSGSRWLVANGMGKKNQKHPLMKSDKSSSGGGSLWSISSRGKGSVKADPPVRNPNVIIPNKTVKLLSGAGFV